MDLGQQADPECRGNHTIASQPDFFMVSTVLAYLAKNVKGDPRLQNIKVRGEICEWKVSARGFTYFAIKDSRGLLSCTAFKRLEGKIGDQVDAQGSISIYPGAGRLQLEVTSIANVGAGSIAEAYERLKRQLQAEGLFDLAHKRSLPPYPRVIGVVTAKTGAVIHDISRTLKLNNASVRIILAPSLVQGERAHLSLIQALHKLEALPEVDCVIIGRGGGSLEDLMAFNSEALVRAIYASPKVIVSAVGHESDVTLCDFVSDHRAATPTAAANLVAPRKSQLLADLRTLIEQARGSVASDLQSKHQELANWKHRTSLQAPSRQLHDRYQLVDELRERAKRSLQGTIRLKRQELQAWQARLRLLSPRELLFKRHESLSSILSRLRLLQPQLLSPFKESLRLLRSSLEGLSPQRVLERGYVLLTDESGLVLDSVHKLKPNKQVKLQLQDGTACAQILSSHQSTDS